MPQRNRLRDESSVAEPPAAGWDPYEVWYNRVHLPRLERERKPREHEPAGQRRLDRSARSPA